jgi:hypothetical protein
MPSIGLCGVHVSLWRAESGFMPVESCFNAGARRALQQAENDP